MGLASFARSCSFRTPSPGCPSPRYPPLYEGPVLEHDAARILYRPYPLPTSSRGRFPRHERAHAYEHVVPDHNGYRELGVDEPHLDGPGA